MRSTLTPIDKTLRKDLVEYLEKVGLIDRRALQLLERLRPKKRGRKKGYRKPIVCADCNEYFVEKLGDSCPGCEAYKDHQR